MAVNKLWLKITGIAVVMAIFFVTVFQSTEAQMQQE
jgi:hypothetical protein